MGRLENKVALVTGGARGVGRGISERFAAEGAKVVLIGRTADVGKQVEESIREAGGEATFVQADISVEADVEHAVSVAVDRYGRLDCLINNAAMLDSNGDGPIGDVPAEAWHTLMNTNALGTFLCCKHAVRAMSAGGGGSIVNVSSCTSVYAIPSTTAYSASKGAVNALSRCIAVDYRDADIRCNTVILGVFPGERLAFFETVPQFRDALLATHLTPRLGRPDDVALACVFLGSDESGFITGAELMIDGGAHASTPYPTASMLAGYADYQNA